MAAETNKACLLYGPGDARFEEIPIPSLENNPRDVLVRIAYTGVCGSDVSPFARTDAGWLVSLTSHPLRFISGRTGA